MRSMVPLFSLVLLAGVATSGLARSPHPAPGPVVGRWLAVQPANGYTLFGSDGQPVQHLLHPARPVTLIFQADKHASIQWGDSAKVLSFTYRVINSKLIEFDYADGRKPRRHSFTITNNNLRLAPYPTPKEPQESIAILYTLTFVKQR